MSHAEGCNNYRNRVLTFFSHQHPIALVATSAPAQLNSIIYSSCANTASTFVDELLGCKVAQVSAPFYLSH